MGKSHISLLLFYLGWIGAGLAIAARDPGTVAAIVSALFIAFGVFGCLVIFITRPQLQPLGKLMAEGRAIRDRMTVGKVNPGNSRIMEPICKGWERVVHDTVYRFDAALATSFVLGSPELTESGYDRYSWLQFMERRLAQLGDITNQLRERS